MKIISHFFLCTILVVLISCKKGDNNENQAEIISPASTFTFSSLKVNGIFNGFSYYDLNTSPILKLSFSTAIDRASAAKAITITSKEGVSIPFLVELEDSDKTVLIQPSIQLNWISQYTFAVSTDLLSTQKTKLQSPIDVKLVTTINPADKFPILSDNDLLDLTQKQTFRYFWDFGHPISGLARERNTSGDVVTTGGSGFGVMALVVGVHRGFISRAEGLGRAQKIVDFLKTKAQRFHGAFPHWLNGSTGAVVPFSPKDNGADLVETSFLIQGLLTARQYFNRTDAAEVSLRNDINSIWNEVEWSWFRKNNENVLYWHWSPQYNWDMNHPIRGWNESLITYVLAASSPSYSIPKVVYDQGWAQSGSMKNGNTYYGVHLPLGPPGGGPLFFEHYSFLGINPNGLSDAYANYETQTRAHTLLNYNYSQANPLAFYGYGPDNWGLTASDIPGGYTASSPTNDRGVIAPTAALSSFPYTPAESMRALKFFYYKLGDKIWKDYGFVDAFSLHHTWFANSSLAIDQGPIIIMIENYRSGLLWNLFMSCPEVKTGMKNLGFQSPHL